VSDNNGWLSMKTAPRDEDTSIMLFTRRGQVEARFSPGYWTETLEGREYNGPVWVCCDDTFQIEIEHTGPDEYHDGEALFWRPLFQKPITEQEPTIGDQR
jgi:hypothetical protein